jgi:predicted ArsR family transcriptional regulator
MSALSLTLLERRRIEAEFAKALLDVLAEDIGRARATEILSKTIMRLAEASGREFAATAADGQADLLAYAEILPLWSAGDALTVDLKEKGAGRLEFDVTRCRFAEMYKELGIPELGAVLSCNRDGAFCQGFNPAIKLTRTQTIMEGADHCDFRYVTAQAPE